MTATALPPADNRAQAAMYEPIAKDLVEVERVFRQTLGSAKPHLAPLIEHLNHFRGKRLRPVLLLLAAKACGEVGRAHHILGAVVEMIHTATLVHDDVLDDAGVRRHVRTVNAGWGNKTSILLGDFLFTHAFHLTSTIGDARACEWIGQATNRVCEGELRQTYERGNLSLGEEEYFDIIDGKTAALTACACQLGAFYAGATPDLVGRLETYGRKLGLAFQVADDLLDLTGIELRAGKTLGTDLQQQKLTLPLIHVLDRVNVTEADRIRRIMQAPGNHKLEQLLPVLEETNAIRDARLRAESLAREAAAELDVLPASPCRDVLISLTEWVVARDV